MIALFCFLLTVFASPLKSKSRLEAENAGCPFENFHPVWIGMVG